MNPKNADLYYNLGLVFHQQGDLEAAAAEYKKAIEIDPQHFDAYYCLGNIYTEQGDLKTAEIFYRTAIQINPRDAGYTTI